MLTVAKNICLDISKTKMSLKFDHIACGVSSMESLFDFWPLAHVSGPTSNKLVVVVVLLLLGNVHTFKYGVIWKQL